MPTKPILLGKYQFERLIGQGAFAQVLLATHLELKVPRALKVLRKDAPGLGSSEFGDYRQRFQLEAQLGAQLHHPNVIEVYDFGREGDMLVLVMEYAAAGNLAAPIARARQTGQPIPVDAVLKMAVEVAEGLAAIHALDAVHRDLKPGNILFDKQGRAKVADLGLAQIPGGLSERTQLGSLALRHPGTPAYMSPEQETTYGHLTPASDIFALGCVLFEALTGRQYKNVRLGTHARYLRPDVPEWLDDLLVRMLAENHQERPWDGAEVADLLHKGLAAGKIIRKKATGRGEARKTAWGAEPATIPSKVAQKARPVGEMRLSLSAPEGKDKLSILKWLIGTWKDPDVHVNRRGQLVVKTPAVFPPKEEVFKPYIPVLAIANENGIRGRNYSALLTRSGKVIFQPLNQGSREAGTVVRFRLTNAEISAVMSHYLEWKRPAAE